MCNYLIALVIRILVTFNISSCYANQNVVFGEELPTCQIKVIDNTMINEQVNNYQFQAKDTENQVVKMKEEIPPLYLYKIVSKEQWQDSLPLKKIITSSIDIDFIHLAKQDQIIHVAQKFWNNTDYVVLKVSSKKLIGRLIYENNPGGSNKYYHLYDGYIPLDAVEEVIENKY